MAANPDRVRPSVVLLGVCSAGTLTSRPRSGEAARTTAVSFGQAAAGAPNWRGAARAEVGAHVPGPRGPSRRRPRPVRHRPARRAGRARSARPGRGGTCPLPRRRPEPGRRALRRRRAMGRPASRGGRAARATRREGRGTPVVGSREPPRDERGGRPRPAWPRRDPLPRRTGSLQRSQPSRASTVHQAFLGGYARRPFRPRRRQHFVPPIRGLRRAMPNRAGRISALVAMSALVAAA
jgi:hypothetical protein